MLLHGSGGGFFIQFQVLFLSRFLLADQLIFEYDEKLTEEAQYAIDNLD